MKTVLFIAIVLVSGCFAGTIHGLVNLAIVEPYLDEAIGIENTGTISSVDLSNGEYTFYATGNDPNALVITNLYSFFSPDKDINVEDYVKKITSYLNSKNVMKKCYVIVSDVH